MDLFQRAIERSLGLGAVAFDFGESSIVDGRDQGGERFAARSLAEGLLEIDVVDRLARLRRHMAAASEQTSSRSTVFAGLFSSRREFFQSLKSGVPAWAGQTGKEPGFAPAG